MASVTVVSVVPDAPLSISPAMPLGMTPATVGGGGGGSVLPLVVVQAGEVEYTPPDGYKTNHLPSLRQP